jgi:hypothetical protein
MNAVRIMQNVAKIQLVIAVISTLVFLLPSLYSFLTIVLILPMIGIWWLGIRLIVGYCNISEGNFSIQEIQHFWIGSWLFNIPGFVGLLIMLLLSSSLSLEYWLAMSPSIAGTILSSIALLIPAENQNLEFQKFTKM